MAWKKRIGKTLEIRLSAGGNESRDTGVADKYYVSVVIKTRRSIREIHYKFKKPFSRRTLQDFEQSARDMDPVSPRLKEPTLSGSLVMSHSEIRGVDSTGRLR